MPISFIYWLMVFLWLIFECLPFFDARYVGWRPVGSIFLLILFLLIGLHDFGAPLLMR